MRRTKITSKRYGHCLHICGARFWMETGMSLRGNISTDLISRKTLCGAKRSIGESGGRVGFPSIGDLNIRRPFIGTRRFPETMGESQLRQYEDWRSLG